LIHATCNPHHYYSVQELISNKCSNFPKSADVKISAAIQYFWLRTLHHDLCISCQEPQARSSKYLSRYIFKNVLLMPHLFPNRRISSRRDRHNIGGITGRDQDSFGLSFGNISCVLNNDVAKVHPWWNNLHTRPNQTINIQGCTVFKYRRCCQQLRCI
jgi:hypothetical protein